MNEHDSKNADPRIPVLETQYSNLERYFDKIDQTLDRLIDLSQSIEKIIAVHETRLDQQEQVDQELSDGQKLIHDRINNMKLEINEKFDKMNEKLDVLNRWGWIGVGVVTLCVFVISNAENIMSIIG